MTVQKKPAARSPRPGGHDDTPMYRRARVLLSRLRDELSISGLLPEETIEALMTHPNPPAPLRDLRDALRRAAEAKAEVTRQKCLIDVLHCAAAVTYLKDFGSLAVFSLAYLATFSRDLLLLRDVAQFAAAAMDIRRDAVVYSTLRGLARLPIDEEVGTQIVVAACKAAWSMIIPAYAQAPSPFASWDARQREAAVTLIELAYGVGHVSSQIEVTEPRKLACDLRGAGATVLGALTRCSPTEAPRSPELARDLRPSGASILGALTGERPVDEQATRIARLLLAMEGNATVPEVGGEVPPGMLVVCPFEIPPSAERAERDEIARHQVLRQPFPLAAFPARTELERVRLQFLDEFPWAAGAIEVVIGELIGMKALGVRDLVLPPTLFVGPPGAGKTRLARRIAEELKLPRIDVALGGSADHKALAGTSRGWGGGRPGDVISFLASRRSASALVLLDELDKASGDFGTNGGSLHSYLLALLEPETACRHYDCFLKTSCDLSRVSWICTANAVSTLPGPLRSRLRVLAVPAPRREHAEAIARGALRDIERRWQLPKGTAPGLEELGVRVDRLNSARQLRVAVEAGLLSWSRRHQLH